jgi:hypothetical protein
MPHTPQALEWWVNAHTDLWHPGSRNECSDCQWMIAAFGPMPSLAELRAAATAIQKQRDANRYRKQPIPQALRQEIFTRDEYRCKHCGSTKDLRVDHIHPERHGGTLHPDNLQTLCHSCNSRKGARTEAPR